MKTVLITGASGGIGLETAKLLAQRGYTLTLVARSGDKLENIKNSLSGTNHSVFVADLSAAGDVKRLTTHLEEKKYDILVNNAGAGLYGKFIDLPLEEQISGMHLNMDAVVTLSYVFLKMQKKGTRLSILLRSLGILLFQVLRLMPLQKVLWPLFQNLSGTNSRQRTYLCTASILVLRKRSFMSMQERRAAYILTSYCHRQRMLQESWLHHWKAERNQELYKVGRTD